MALAKHTHHASRGQTRPTAREGVEHEKNAGLWALGKRPPPLVEVRPQGKTVQHSGIGFELVQALNVPVLEVVEQPVEVVSGFRNSLPVVAEQVIELPKLALPDGFLLRTFPLEP